MSWILQTLLLKILSISVVSLSVILIFLYSFIFFYQLLISIYRDSPRTIDEQLQTIQQIQFQQIRKIKEEQEREEMEKLNPSAVGFQNYIAAFKGGFEEEVSDIYNKRESNEDLVQRQRQREKERQRLKDREIQANNQRREEEKYLKQGKNNKRKIKNNVKWFKQDVNVSDIMSRDNISKPNIRFIDSYFL